MSDEIPTGLCELVEQYFDLHSLSCVPWASRLDDRCECRSKGALRAGDLLIVVPIGTTGRDERSWNSSQRPPILSAVVHGAHGSGLISTSNTAYFRRCFRTVEGEKK